MSARTVIPKAEKLKRAHILYPDGRVSIWAGTKKPTLEEMQGWVGGYIQAVTFQYNGKRLKGVVNEDGKLKGLPYNANATRAMQATHSYALNDCIVGTAVILEGWRI